MRVNKEKTIRRIYLRMISNASKFLRNHHNVNTNYYDGDGKEVEWAHRKLTDGEIFELLNFEQDHIMYCAKRMYDFFYDDKGHRRDDQYKNDKVFDAENFEEFADGVGDRLHNNISDRRRFYM